MTTQKLLSALALIALGVLAACGSTAQAENTSADTASENIAINEGYDDALTIRNQLLLGSLRLEEGQLAITAEQAAELTTLWQALAALSASGTAAPEETEAIQNQIIAALTPEQVRAIATMGLTNGELQAFYVEAGISEVKTPEPGMTPQSESGGMRNLSQADREATRTASGGEVGGGNSSGSKSDALLALVLEMLASK
ncbi:MAG: hypothetical protein KDE34_22170 [Anaerolineales bacterium]|nr:hypothetical protein [Anaerolineales bacterium]